ncbi:MAG TPA: hypothetical protein VKA69_11665 [Desulfobacteria bacterium]|nr:hypothetical protein [Desulfobacteria bacterium]
MRKRIPLLLFLLWCAPVITVLEGCPIHQSLQPVGEVYVETIPSSRAYLSNINVKQNGGDLVISGEVSRRNTAFSGLGHVDVAVVSPDETVIGQANAVYSPKVLPKTPGARKHRPSHFEVHLNCIPPQGSIVRVAYHGKPDPDDPLMDLQENYAIPEHHDQGD